MRRSTRAYYDAFAPAYEAHRHQPYHRMLDDAEVALVQRFGTGQACLEVGCGTGLLLARVRTFAARAVGIDASPGMLELAKARGLEVWEGDACALPFADDTFDLTYAFKVLPHVPDLQRALAEMVRVTRPGGLVIAEFYNTHSLRTLTKRLRPAAPIRPGLDTSHVYTAYHTPAQALAALPTELSIRATCGIRIFTPAAFLHRVPGLGPLLRQAETFGQHHPTLLRFGGFFVICAQKTNAA